ncbi:MAG: flavin reductase, partial [Clostridia bacterium]|nr:flavin reductase [Clostridia bacterium]
IIQELPLVLECKLVSYDTQTEICIGEVVNVSVDERILDEKGKIDVEMLDPLVYASEVRGYYTLGEKVGKAFFDGLQLK